MSNCTRCFQPLPSRRAWVRIAATSMLCLPPLLGPAPARAADHFTVVSIKPAEKPTGIRRHSPGRIRYEGIAHWELIKKAFALPSYLVIRPDWVAGPPPDHRPKENPDQRFFTIDATMPPEASEAEFRLMLQNLLVERFGLAFHRETRQLTQYDLSFADGGPRMPLAKAVPDGPLEGLPEDNENLARTKHENASHVLFGAFGMRLKGEYTVAGIAAWFSQYLQHPMVDETGSTEYYAIDLTWDWNPYSVPPDPSIGVNRASNSEARELFSELEKKLGLKVTLRTVPAEFLVIDRLRHEATEN